MIKLLKSEMILFPPIFQSFPLILQIIFKEIENGPIGKLFMVDYFSKTYIIRVELQERDLLSVSLNDIIPPLNDFIHNTKQEVAQIALDVLTLDMKGITNKDVEPFIPDLIEAMQHPEEIEETIQKLGGVVFVQTIDNSTLSVIVPLMQAGFKHPKFLIKRLCSRIVSNMSKLVEDPIEAEPFLGSLLSCIDYCIDTIANPEVREVATSTHQTLLNIDVQAKKAIKLPNNKYRNETDVRINFQKI